MQSPWTRDGKIRAEQVSITPQVSGRIVELNIKDNQLVNAGDLLLTIDKTPFQIAELNAQAQLAKAQSDLAKANNEANRRRHLSQNFISAEELDTANLNVKAMQASVDAAQATLKQTQWQLAQTEIRAPVSGWVTNLTTRIGDYADTGKPLFALVDSHSFYVIGYFEETKLRHIREGAPAQITLYSDNKTLQGQTEAAENATAIGNNAKAKGTNSMAMGFGSLADKVNTIALGNGSQALADNAIAIGQGNKADGVDAIALGNGSQSRGLNTIALGTASNATGDKSLALGSNSSANGINSVALGADSIADLDNTVSVGNSSLKRKIVNVKNGAIKSDSYDAINGSQLYAISDSVAKRLGGGAAVDVDDGTVTAPTYNLKNGSKNNVGAALAVLDENTLQWDQTKGKYSAAHGTSSPTASVITDVADGTISASSKDAVNGSQLKATNDDVEANTANIATNTSNIATNTANIATNTTNITNLTDSVGDLQADALLWNETKKAFSAAHGQDTTSKITNVKDADLTADSTDAVNGSQLKTTNDAVATNTTNIANNTSNIATNTTNISNLTETVTNLGEDALKWDKDNGVFTAAHGTETTSKITNVKDGDLTTGSTDAVNGSQLKTTNDAVATNTTNIATNTTNISNLTETVTNLGEDALKWDKDNGVFTAAHGNNTASKITNILDGTVTATSSDAINGSQLYDLSSNIATYFGGNASVNTDGVFTGPTYKIGETNYYNVGDALAAINSSFSTSLGDALLWDATAGKFSAKHGTNGDASVITDVADGEISDSSSDAVNGSQLHGVSSYVVDALGGGAEVNADGTITAPTYTIANADYDNVGDALNAIDTTLDDALLWDADAGENGAFSAAHGKDKTASVITNVANGAISAASSDAINGSQLYTTNKYIADALGGDAEVNADGTITAPTYTIANAEYNNVGDALDALDDNALLWDETANGGAG
ncbi:adhesin, partial [Escherichia coli O157:H7 str. 2011EL-2114]